MAVRRAEKTRITSGEIDWVFKESDTDYHEQFDGGSLSPSHAMAAWSQ